MQGQITPPENMSQLHDILPTEMTEAQLRHKKYWDERRKPHPNLQSGDMVWLLLRNMVTTRPCKKLDYKKIGPFKILAKIGESAYKLDLPPSMMLHNTFHISLLGLYHDDKFPSKRTQPPPPIILKGQPEYELEESVDSRLHYGELQYRVKWTGYPPKHDKVWYRYNNFENAEIAKQQFHQQYAGKPSHDQDQRARKRRDVGLNITNTATLATNTASENDDTKTPSTRDAARRRGSMIGLPTSPPYRRPHEWEEAERTERARQEHDQLPWTACYNDGCQTHFRDQEATGWFPKDQSQSAPSVPISHRNKKQQRKRHEKDSTWNKCYEDKCFVQGQEKITAGYYPQENGERKTLSRWHRNHPEPEQQRKFGAVRTLQEREGSEKTQREVGALEASPGTGGRKGSIPEKARTNTEGR